RFSNGSVEKNFSDAKNALWVTNPVYWGCLDFGDGDISCSFLVKSSGNIASNEGYYFYSGIDNITLVRQN
ncbi:MAG: hypothetical protein WCX73_04795, partial [Candidatus Pacearchaeota archaeon]